MSSCVSVRQPFGMERYLKIQSVELISRKTQTSARLLVALSAGIIAIVHYDLNSTAWDFLGREIQPQQFREIASAVLAFFMISHLIHWITDHTVYSKWFQTNHVTGDDIGVIGSFKDSKRSMKDAMFVRLQRVEKDIETLEGKISSTSKAPGADRRAVKSAAFNVSSIRELMTNLSKKQSDIETSLDEMQSVIEDIAPGFKEVSFLARVVVYGWYLALPTCSGVLSAGYMWWSLM